MDDKILNITNNKIIINMDDNNFWNYGGKILNMDEKIFIIADVDDKIVNLLDDKII